LCANHNLAQGVIVIPPYIRLGPSVPLHPVLISVPHAGRNHPEAMQLLSRLPVMDLITLEDRYADRLIGLAVESSISAIVATTPRAWIDLNRAENDYDPGFVDGAAVGPPLGSSKMRGGLGIIPRRIARGGDIWKGRISADAFAARLEDHHRPYHAALGGMIAATLTQFGIAIVLDVHSMPPLLPQESAMPAPRVIIGDSFGRSASGRFSDCATHVVRAQSLHVACNVPYAGGYILERHGAPARGVHALQIEIDRSLYLDAALREPAHGLQTVQALIRQIAISLAQEAASNPLMQAAE
jgi:N-formylglutamate amidohydrolase